MRFFSLALLSVLTVAAVSATTAVAPIGASGAMIEQDASSSSQRVLGVHYLSLKDGVTPEDFERFVVEEWNPVMSDRFPGVRIMLMKGERNAKDGEYLAVYDVQTADVRDWYWPTPDTVSEVFEALNETCGEACNNVVEQLFTNMTEQTSYTDYVEITRD